MEYHEMPMLAPEKSILIEYRKTGDWAKYERDYLNLIRIRQVEKLIPSKLIDEGIVLLCSETEATHCHRRLSAEYLARSISAVIKIVHL